MSPCRLIVEVENNLNPYSSINPMIKYLKCVIDHIKVILRDGLKFVVFIYRVSSVNNNKNNEFIKVIGIKLSILI